MDDDSDEVSEVIGRSIKFDEDIDDKIEGFPTMVERPPVRKNVQKNATMEGKYKRIHKNDNYIN